MLIYTNRKRNYSPKYCRYNSVSSIYFQPIKIKNFALLTTTWAGNLAGEIFALFAKIATDEFVSSMFVLGKIFVYFTAFEASNISHVPQSIYTI